MTGGYGQDAFIESSLAYLRQLKRASTFDEMLTLWRSTSIPYSIGSIDPYSPEYRNEVEAIYGRLAGCEYSSSNELTSTKQSEAEFELGFPWVSGNLEIVAAELAKPVQILQALHASGKTDARIIEFGSGWGNLALPLARARQDVSIVDIDQGFIDRILRKAQHEGLTISSYCGDFLDVAQEVDGKFDVAIFQSSLHHCIDFITLLAVIKDRVLNSGGIIIFASEPISMDTPFPWGLRFDGESLWAIMCNQWLELGFNQDFFSEMLLNTGFFFERVAGIPGFVGEAWKGHRCENGLDFANWMLPSHYDATFHAAEAGVAGRFCKAQSALPGLKNPNGEIYELSFVNYGTRPLAITVGGEKIKRRVVDAGCNEVVEVEIGRGAAVIKSETFIPDQQCGNGDARVLGVHLNRVRLI